MSFSFKQFTVVDDGAAMKVGTDGVLLGAWASAAGGRILDIGTGSGLIALMLAQRCPEAAIDAIDIDHTAVAQANANFAASPWGNRLHALLADVNTYHAEPYDLIVANPPFFSNSLPAKGEKRQQARHDDTLTLDQLFAAARRLIAAGGRLAVVLPAESRVSAIALAADNSLTLARATTIVTRPDAEPKRVLLEFGAARQPIGQVDRLAIYTPSGEYTEAYRALCRDFYLKF